MSVTFFSRKDLIGLLLLALLIVVVLPLASTSSG